MGKQRFLGLKAQGLIHFGGTTFLDGETIVVGNKTYELDDDASVEAGAVLIDISDTTAAVVAAAFIAAFNLNKPTPGVTAVIDPKSNVTVHLIADARGAAGNMTVSDTVADAASCVVSSLIGGEAGGTQTEARGSHTVTASDVLADNIMIETGLTSPRFITVTTRTAAGVEKAVTAEVTVSGSKIRYNFAGATDPVATDVITWEAWE